MRSIFHVTFVAVAILTTASTAVADFHQVDTAATHNQRLQEIFLFWADAFPEGPQVFQDVPFDIAPVGEDRLNIWYAYAAANQMHDVEVVQDFPINVRGVQTLYTLMNTAWGIPGEHGAYLYCRFLR